MEFPSMATRWDKAQVVLDDLGELFQPLRFWDCRIFLLLTGPCGVTPCTEGAEGTGRISGNSLIPLTSFRICQEQRANEGDAIPRNWEKVKTRRFIHIPLLQPLQKQLGFSKNQQDTVTRGSHQRDMRRGVGAYPEMTAIPKGKFQLISQVLGSPKALQSFRVIMG